MPIEMTTSEAIVFAVLAVFGLAGAAPFWPNRRASLDDPPAGLFRRVLRLIWLLMAMVHTVDVILYGWASLGVFVRHPVIYLFFILVGVPVVSGVSTWIYSNVFTALEPLKLDPARTGPAPSENQSSHPK